VLVYRDASRKLAGAEVVSELLDVSRIGADVQRRWSALSVAGELEAALADLEHTAAPIAADCTDELARACVTGDTAPARARLARLSRERLPDQVVLKRPEGYAFYALDPTRYGELACRLVRRGERALVIGVRSIGTSLGAIVRVALEQRGISVRRVSVRPGGHPWARELAAQPELARAVRASEGARVLIVDEGPGLSGSTFLAVGECVEALGLSRSQIAFMLSRQVRPERLIAPRAMERWARFTSAVAEAPPLEGAVELTGGAWRRLVYDSEQEWPACWLAMERRKFLRPAGEGVELVKFAGFPPYDRGALERARQLHAGGFAPPVRADVPGYVAHRWCPGRPLSLRALARGPLREAALIRLVSYLAYRHAALPAKDSDTVGLENMLQVNLRDALSRELARPARLELVRPVYADARIAPHEWLLANDGRLLKLDGVDHADDHLWPGPCDVAWDLAGAIVEWRLEREASTLLERYRAATGDDVARRIVPYAIAYSAFRVAHVHFSERSDETSERARLAPEAAYQLARLRRFCEAFEHGRSPW
jgi:hypothetical protein